MKQDIRLLAIGRSGYLYGSIRYLLDQGYTVSGILTDEANQEYDIKPADFESLAHSAGAAFFTAGDLGSPALARWIRDNGIRAAISANWRFRIGPEVLGLFPWGILNFHLGNLPDYKGNATVNWSILNGERHIYANIHRMDAELDAGDIISRWKIPIGEDTYIADIISEAERVAPGLFEDALEKLGADPAYCEVKGTAEGLRCYPRLPEDSQINWNDSMEQISRLIRASAPPYPGSFSFLNGEKVRIWKARPRPDRAAFLAVPGHVVEINRDAGSILVACGDGLMEIQELEYSGTRIPPASLVKSIRSRFK